MQYLHVTSRPASRRRAGMRFTRETTELKVADLSKAQIHALENDPELVVAAAADPETPDGKKAGDTESAPPPAAAPKGRAKAT